MFEPYVGVTTGTTYYYFSGGVEPAGAVCIVVREKRFNNVELLDVLTYRGLGVTAKQNVRDA